MLKYGYMLNIRLANWEIEAITSSFKDCFKEEDHLWIFGSRVYPEKKGGDIDIYIEPKVFDSQVIYTSRSNFWVMLQDKLGEQKIDIVIKDPSQDLLIYKIAKKEGVQLV